MTSTGNLYTNSETNSNRVEVIMSSSKEERPPCRAILWPLVLLLLLQ